MLFAVSLAGQFFRSSSSQTYCKFGTVTSTTCALTYALTEANAEKSILRCYVCFNDSKSHEFHGPSSRAIKNAKKRRYSTSQRASALQL